MTESTTELVQRVLRGERSSFDDVVAWYSEDVLRLSYLLLRDREEARDVLQEAMLRLVRSVRGGKFRSVNGSIKGFLITTARNLCIDRLKKRVDFQGLRDDDTFLDSALREMHTPDRAMDEARFRSAFQDALGQLTEAQRTVLVLHEVNGESQATIADTLNLSAECVRTHLCRARRRMRVLWARFASES